MSVAHGQLNSADAERDAPAALAEIEQDRRELWRMLYLSMVYHALSRKADSDKALDAVIAKYEKDAAYNIAYVYAFRANLTRHSSAQ